MGAGRKKKQLNLAEPCSKCNGTGKVNNAPCPDCQGKGTVLTAEGKKVLHFLRNSIALSEH